MDDRDPLPPGHPEERPWESACIIQRNPAIDNAEAGLRFATTALIADASRSVTVADAAGKLRTIRSVQEGSFSVKPFYPEHFLIECHSGETRDTILGRPRYRSPAPTSSCYFGRGWCTPMPEQ